MLAAILSSNGTALLFRVLCVFNSQCLCVRRGERAGMASKCQRCQPNITLSITRQIRYSLFSFAKNILFFDGFRYTSLYLCVCLTKAISSLVSHIPALHQPRRRVTDESHCTRELPVYSPENQTHSDRKKDRVCAQQPIN